MADTEASEAARRLANLRWSPSHRLEHAVSVVVQRSAELRPEQLAELAAVLGQEEEDGSE